MDGRHPGLVRHVGDALHSDSKEQTAMEETGSLRDPRHSALRMQCNDDHYDDDAGCDKKYPLKVFLLFISYDLQFCISEF